VKKKMIYAVTSGTYSDYRINALFSSKKKAKEFLSAMNGNSEIYDDFNDVEEYELDPPTADLLKRGYSVWFVLMLKDGTVERAKKTDNDKYDIGDTGCYRIWERTKAPAFRKKVIPDALEMSVWAKSEIAAIKIVNEKRAHMIAFGEW
jgi:hypothetical protein